jgi:hypothetical protein
VPPCDRMIWCDAVGNGGVAGTRPPLSPSSGCYFFWSRAVRKMSLYCCARLVVVRILFAVGPGYGLMLSIVPLMWAARAAGHEILVATTSEMTEVGARAGLPIVDVFPQRDVWSELVNAVFGKGNPDDLPEEYRLAKKDGNPFGLFTLTMTEGTIAAGRVFGADLVVYTSDHVSGRLTAVALAVPALKSVTGSPGRCATSSSERSMTLPEPTRSPDFCGPSWTSVQATRSWWPGSTRGHRAWVGCPPTSRTSAMVFRGGRCVSCPTTAGRWCPSGHCARPRGPGCASRSALWCLS